MSILSPGFADPVADSQSAFRAVLDALSRPGSVMPAGDGLAPPAPLLPAAAAMLLTLVDAETTLWIDPALADVAPWIAFHCGAPVVSDITQARFILAASLPELATLEAGSHDGPEDSSTVILQLAALEGGPALRLSGPGLAAPTGFAPAGLPADFVAQWARNHAAFPRGVDLVLCAPATVAALPRSVRIEEAR